MDTGINAPINICDIVWYTIHHLQYSHRKMFAVAHDQLNIWDDFTPSTIISYRMSKILESV